MATDPDNSSTPPSKEPWTDRRPSLKSLLDAMEIHCKLYLKYPKSVLIKAFNRVKEEWPEASKFPPPVFFLERINAVLTEPQPIRRDTTAVIEAIVQANPRLQGLPIQRWLDEGHAVQQEYIRRGATAKNADDYHRQITAIREELGFEPLD